MMTPPKTQHAINTYVDVFTSLTPGQLDALMALLADDVIFSDPFNEVQGKAGFRGIFEHMFNTCTDPKFTVSDVAAGKQAYYLRWQMTGRLTAWPRTPLKLDGMSEIRINAAGQISHHIDHWDSASQLLMTLPIIRVVIKPIMRLFRIS